MSAIAVNARGCCRDVVALRVLIQSASMHNDNWSVFGILESDFFSHSKTEEEIDAIFYGDSPPGAVDGHRVVRVHPGEGSRAFRVVINRRMEFSFLGYTVEERSVLLRFNQGDKFFATLISHFAHGDGWYESLGASSKLLNIALDTRRRERFVLWLGDLNVDPYSNDLEHVEKSAALSRLARSYGLSWHMESIEERVVTRREGNQESAIDHVLHSSALSVSAKYSFEESPADHAFVSGKTDLAIRRRHKTRMKKRWNPPSDETIVSESKQLCEQLPVPDVVSSVDESIKVLEMFLSTNIDQHKVGEYGHSSDMVEHADVIEASLALIGEMLRRIEKAEARQHTRSESEGLKELRLC